MKKYIITNRVTSSIDIETYFNIYGTKKPSVLRNKVINSTDRLVDVLKCYSFNFNTKKLNDYNRFNHLLEFKKELLDNNQEDKFKFYGINIYSNIIRFYTDDVNRESKLLILKVNDNIGLFIKHFEEIGFNILRKTSFNNLLIMNVEKNNVEEILLLASLQFNIDNEYDLIYLDGNKILY